MFTGKKKRAWCADLSSFPNENPEEVRRNTGAAMAMASVSSTWLRCGDGFQTASSLETSGAQGKTSRAKNCFTSLFNGTEGIPKSDSLSDFVDIAWTSSESDFSDDDSKTLSSRCLSFSVERERKCDWIFKSQCTEDEQHFIDWENDSDYQNTCSTINDIPLDISDTESFTSSDFTHDEEEEAEPAERFSEILEYSSESDNMEECQEGTETVDLDLSKNLHLHLGTGIKVDTGRSASEWLKSAQAFLQTPNKKTVKSLRTPEDSAKKRKCRRGGLAERLNRLQNRERAAINIWRHQSISDDQTPSAGDPGVLIVKILEMHEECSLYVAICHQLGQVYADSSAEEVADIQTRLKVIFSKETAAHLKAAPQDVIYIHPTWHKLLLPNENIPVIMNTYFSQNVLPKEPREMDWPHFQELLYTTKRNIYLGKTFNLSTIKDNQPQAVVVKQVSHSNMKICNASNSHCSNELKLSPSGITSLSKSLLDVVEIQGMTGGRRMPVQVVVQRVYYLPAKESFICCLQGNSSAPNMGPLLNSDLPNIRLCFLIQDVCGILSEVHLQIPISSRERITSYIDRWEGQCCCLSGIKILQRVTRGKMLGLFSLIDSFWPPLLPQTVAGRSQENETEFIANLPPPGFCYILAAYPEETDLDPNKREQIASLYRPPDVQNLREILQVCSLNQCCSFWAHVTYRRLQGSPPSSQRQFWLFVTDSSLQDDSEVSPGTPKTLPVSVASSCVIEREVMKVLKNTSCPCVVFFRDALCGNGKIICVERTVLLLQKPLLYRTVGADIAELTGPVKLDELDSATLVNSICTVRGTVAGVNEGTAFSWPTCNRCGNGKIEQQPQNRGLLYCSQCSESVISPVLKMNLEIFLHCPSRPVCTVKVKLQQKTASSLLKASPTVDGHYEVKSVLGKELGLLDCYVHSITRHPSCVVGLEEIAFPSAPRP